MARATFRPQVRLDPNQRARFDTAPDSDSPADVWYVDQAMPIPGAIVSADWDGFLPPVLGPDGVDTLYLKGINRYTGGTGSPVTCTAPLPVEPAATLTGDAGTLVGPTGGGGVGLFNPPRRVFPSFKDTPVTSFQTGHGWTKTSTAGAIAADTGDYAFGSQSLAITTDGAANTVLVSSPTLSPVLDLSGQQLAVMIRLDDAIPAGRFGDFQIRVSSNAFADYAYAKCVYSPAAQQWLQPGVWTLLTLSAAEAVSGQVWGAGGWSYYGTKTNVNWAAINGIRFRLTDAGTGTPLTVKVNLVSYFPRPAKPALSILFDDARASAYTVAKPILDAYRLGATAMITAQALGQSGYMTVSQVRALARNDKWATGVHANSGLVHSAGYDAVSYRDGETDLLRAKAALEAQGLTGAHFMAYPQGSWDLGGGSVDVLGMVRKYMDSARSSHGLTVETYPPADPYRLRSGTVTQEHTATQLLALIDAAIAGKAWLLMTWHDLVTTPTMWSDSTPAVFQLVADGIATRVAAGTLIVRTPEEILQYGMV